MRFEALQARYGDCLLLSFRGSDRPIRLLVDGGPGNVFKPFLEPRLEEERKARPDEKPLVLDAVMVSHIDEDHILGILELLGALQDADARRAPWPWKPRWLLHNSFDALAGEGEGGSARRAGGATVLAGLGQALELPGGKTADEGARKVLQSYPQGSKLSSLAAALRIARNPPDQSVLMFDGVKPRRLAMGDATLTVVGPLKEEVDKLRAKWLEWQAKKDKQKKPEASLAAYLDRSVPNLASIVALVEEKGKRILLTGDARGDKVLRGLELAKLLPAAGKGAMQVDILKLPHHGSVRNLDHDFFERIHADHYVASGDGTHGNPDREMFEMIEKARPEGGCTIHITYPAAQCDTTHEAWLRARSKDFDPKKHAIAPVVDRLRAAGKIAVKEGPVAIDL
jgi:hypothetical protein